MDSRAWSHVLYGLAALGVLWFALRPRSAVGRVGTGTIGPENALLSLPMSTVKQPPITANTLAIIRQEEGLRLTPYRDGDGYSIGYGHYLGTKASAPGTRITTAQAETYLMQDATDAAETIRKYVRVPLGQNQFDALVSFVFNVGAPAFIRSTLLRRLNEKNFPAASEQFRRWVYQGSTVLQALVSRRSREKSLFLA